MTTKVVLEFKNGCTMLNVYHPKFEKGYTTNELLETTTPKASSLERLRKYGQKRAKTLKCAFHDLTV